MFIEKFLKHDSDRHLTNFAQSCGLELDKYVICDGYIRVVLINPKNNHKSFYNLFDFHIEEPETGIHSMENTTNLLMVQKAWRTYLRSMFANQYVIRFNSWLDSQKLQYVSRGRNV